MKEFKKSIVLLSLGLILVSCGGKSGGDSDSTTGQRSPIGCNCDTTDEEFSKVAKNLGTFWDDLNSQENSSWRATDLSSKGVYKRSIFFGQEFASLEMSTKLTSKTLTDDEIEMIFIHFNKAVEEKARPDLNSIAKKLLTKKATI